MSIIVLACNFFPIEFAAFTAIFATREIMISVIRVTMLALVGNFVDVALRAKIAIMIFGHFRHHFEPF